MCLVPRPLAFFSMGRNQFSRSLPVGSCSLFLAACCLAVSVSLAPSSNLLAVAVGMVGGLRSRTAVGNFWRNERHGVFWENALPPSFAVEFRPCTLQKIFFLFGGATSIFENRRAWLFDDGQHRGGSGVAGGGGGGSVRNKPSSISMDGTRRPFRQRNTPNLDKGWLQTKPFRILPWLIHRRPPMVVWNTKRRQMWNHRCDLAIPNPDLFILAKEV